MDKKTYWLFTSESTPMIVVCKKGKKVNELGQTMEIACRTSSRKTAKEVNVEPSQGRFALITQQIVTYVCAMGVLCVICNGETVSPFQNPNGFIQSER